MKKFKFLGFIILCFSIIFGVYYAVKKTDFFGYRIYIEKEKTTAEIQQEFFKSYTQKQAQLVYSITKGYIPKNSQIVVVFQEAVPGVSSKEVTDKNYFEFEPNIKGITYWKDSKTLVFRPNAPLKEDIDYAARLYLENIFPNLEEKDRILSFNFKAISLAAYLVESDFIVLDDSNPKEVKYFGKIVFTEPVSKDKVAKAIKLTHMKKTIPLMIKGSLLGTEFEIESQKLERKPERQVFILSVDKKLLDLEKKIVEKCILEGLEKLEPISIYAVRGEEVGFAVTFTDLLDKTCNMDKYIKITPKVDFGTKVIGNKIFILGDFKSGVDYRILLREGIKSKWGIKSKIPAEQTIKFKDAYPQILFDSSGIFLPAPNKSKITFCSINVKRVFVRVVKVYDEELANFVRYKKLSSYNPDSRYDAGYIERIGENLVQKELILSDKKNVWLRHELDLSKIFAKDQKGLYLLTINFSRNDMNFSPEGCKGDKIDINHPLNEKYIYYHGRIYKPIILSDIAAMVKKADTRWIVIVNYISNLKPVGGAQVKALNWAYKPLALEKTNFKGIVEFEIKDQGYYNRPAFFEVTYKNQRTIVKINEMAWNLSGYDIKGADIKEKSVDAFIYTDRGVYRPGDTINIGVIARIDNRPIPAGHPITVYLYNPKNQKIMTKNFRSDKAKNGFLCFPIKTKPSDLTGNYRLDVIIGDNTFRHRIKVETIVPNRLKVYVETEKNRFKKNQLIKGKIKSKYLFGTPAAGLLTSVDITLKTNNKRFKEFEQFYFSHEGIPFKNRDFKIAQNMKLDEKGETLFLWQLPDIEPPPSELLGTIKVKVYEKGGRFSEARHMINIDYYDRYVGIEKMNLKHGRLNFQEENYRARVILLDNNGNPVAGKKLEYKLYTNKRYWWWEYRSDKKYKLNYKSHKDTKLVKEGSFESSSVPKELNIPIMERGSYLLEVSDAESGHTAGIFFIASYWGDTSAEDTAYQMIITSDKKAYFPGETAKITFPSVRKGKSLVTIEKKSEIISMKWYDLKPVKGEMTVRIPITQKMTPNVYVSVAMIQNYEETKNDRPLRMYGVIPLKVIDKQTKDEIKIVTAETFRPKEKFRVKVKNQKGRKMTFSIAVVDEGLLDITDFKTPDPWNYFFRKERYRILNYDMYGSIIGSIKGDIYKKFAIGGDMEEIRIKTESAKKPRRFKPVVLFKGPITTDINGEAEVEFEMPNYIGSVRIMIVAAGERSYGCAEKIVPVKKELMLLPTLPRVIGPDETFVLPVSVFVMSDDIKNVNVKLQVEKPLEIIGNNISSLVFSKTGDKEVFFNVRALPEVGWGKIIISGIAGGYSADFSCGLDVRPSAPRIYSSTEYTLRQGIKETIKVERIGIKGSNNAKLIVNRLPKMHMEKRLYFLIKYPYGCIEQTTSSVFPQLYLKHFIKGSLRDDFKIDENINAGINRLRKFVTPSGGFAFWPGGRKPSGWASNYVGHFLIEAKKLGYYVPSDLMDGWQRYQISMARRSNGSLIERVYRVYLLALSGKPSFGAMNLLKEDYLDKMRNPEKWLLAGAYKLAGSEGIALEIARKASLAVDEYKETGGSYGSTMRDRAIILSMLVLFDFYDEAKQIFKELCENISSQKWYSTQTLGYSLLAMGQYLNKYVIKDNKKFPRMKFTIQYPDGGSETIETYDFNFSRELNDYLGKNIVVSMTSDCELQEIYCTMLFDGIPLKGIIEPKSNNLAVNIEWFSDDGYRIDPLETTQGEVLWGKITVKRSKPSYSTIEEVSVSQVLPSGWEIENLRLMGDSIPSWISSPKQNKEEYMDIRDDRICWFFDLRGNNVYEFVFKVNAITSGEFILPPTQVEAMYDKTYYARTAGWKVRVIQRR